MLANREYADAINEVTNKILKYTQKVKTPFNVANDSKKNLYIIVSSTLGLCGSYNNNVFKVADVAIKPFDDAIILGKKGLIHYEHGEFSKVEGFNEYNSFNDTGIINSLIELIKREYLKGTYHEIHLIYSEYKNSLVFLAKDSIILPLTKVESDELSFGPILEPSEEKLVETLIPIYLKTVVNSKLLESEVCEQGARCNAMDNATNNAQELLDNLKIEFNKARQGAITQEIIEIVSAANAI